MGNKSHECGAFVAGGLLCRAPATRINPEIADWACHRHRLVCQADEMDGRKCEDDAIAWSLARHVWVCERHAEEGAVLIV
jgi:hypothetical protein